ncbi:uncharacterized protein [Hoplias malabaricus]|uniref:uncharacterized protein n=1 Tax=Hoplias malabaricus TaxID=27720 RepID=UPI003462F1CC
MMVNLLLAVLQVLVTVSVTSPLQDPDAGDSTWSLSEPYQDVPVLQFPESSVWLKRRKREWIIPPINFPENSRGPFPKQIVQIESAKARNVKITYSITGGGADLPPVGIFTVDRNTGWLYVNKALDRETKDLYVLKVHAVAAEGEDEPPIDIIVHVIDMNDNKPVFTQDTFHGCVPEVLALGYEFMKVTATDADDPRTDNADIRYSIISQTPTEPHLKMFDINPVTGGIRVAAKGLDIEKHPKYTLEIQAADMLGHGLRTTGKAVITVTDINENAPQFENTSHTVSVPEIALGAVVVKLRVKDEDEPQTPAWTARFHILNGTSDGLFSVSTGPSKQEGIITTAKPLDFEQEKQHTLLVIVENDIPFSKPLPTSTATVTVNVLNAVEPEEKCTCLGHKPYQDVPVLQFPESSVGLKRRKREWVIPPISFPENDRGPFPKQIAQIKSTKAKEVKITYSITGEGADLPPVGLFTVDRNTGWLYVSWPLDREVKDKYVVKLQAHAVAEQGEGENPIEIVANVIDMNDNKPVFTQDIFYGFVPETSPIGFEFMKVTATDADDPISDNADIRYSIISQRPAMPQSHMFAINPVTGAIRVLAKGLDGEKYPEYTLEIQAADMTGQGLTATGKAVITVMGINNHAPQFENTSYTASVPEIALGAVVVKLRVKDEDEPHTPAWTAKFHILNGKSDGLFSVSTGPSKQEGIITTAKPLDFEQEKQYTLLLIVENDIPFSQPLPTSTATVTVNVLNVVEPDEISIALSLKTLSPLSNKGPDPEEGARAVAGFYQDVQVLQFPESSVGLKRRKREWVIPPINFPENDNGPFPKALVQIKSNKSEEVNITYSITGEGADRPPVGLFTINRDTGWLYVTKPVDREFKNKYVLQAHAVAAKGEGEAPIKFIINMIDVNDNVPVFTRSIYKVRVPEATPIGHEFMKVTATDADDPNTENADIRYSIFSQNPVKPNPNMFNINPVTGAIRVSADGLDREKYPEYTLEIQAADWMGTGLTAFAKAIITVTDSNDNAPKFEKTSYTVSVPENTVGAVVVKMAVTDGDEPQSTAWTAKFRIIRGNQGGVFNVSTGPNKQEGIITTVKPLDFETNPKYTLLVVVENDVPFAKPMPTSTATVTVNVLDVNEDPVFDPEVKEVSVPEDAAVGSQLTVFTATDPDTARAQTVTYRVGADAAGWLSVDGENGVVKVKSPMDRKIFPFFVKDGKYRALILAVDDDQVPATGTGTLLINVGDMNDNVPVIEEKMITVCSKEPAPVLLSVTDKDGTGFAAPLKVELQGESRDHWTAKMDKNGTGIVLSPNTALEQGEYNIVLRVYDNGLLYQDHTVLAAVYECIGEVEYFCLKG